MIVGTGFDFIEVDRVQQAAGNELFYTRYFTDNEIIYFRSRKYNMQTVAGQFAAKEAVIKSLGCGLSDISLRDIEILRKESGQPYVTLHGQARTIMQSLGVYCVHVSISHLQQYAAAQAIAEGE